MEQTTAFRSRAALAVAAVAFATSRALILLVGYIAQIEFPFAVADPGRAFAHILPLDALVRWDSAWYLSIVTEGYYYLPDAYSNVAFFPFYPLLIGAASAVLGIAPPSAGLLVSNAAFAAALYALHRLAERELGDADTADRAVWYAAFHPASFFFSAVYTESVFFVLVLGAFWLGGERRWLPAAALAALAAATRSVGILLWGTLGLQWMGTHGWTLLAMHRAEAWRGLWRGLRTDWPGALAIQLSPLGLLVFAAYCHHKFGEPFAFGLAQKNWNRNDAIPHGHWITHWMHTVHNGWLDGVTPDETRLLLDTAAYVLALVAGVWAWRRLGAAYGAFTLLGAIIPANGLTESLVRYVAVLFPTYLMLAEWGRRPLVDRAVLAGFAILMGLRLAMFATVRFAG